MLKVKVLILSLSVLFLISCGTSVETDDTSTTTAETTTDSSGDSSTETTVSTPAISTRFIDDFLWKPNSERDGNLVVLINPRSVRILVTGAISEELVNFGPSNGRGTTARSSNRGCSYGTGVKVEFFELDGTTRILVKDGRQSVTVPNGCDRLEFRL